MDLRPINLSLPEAVKDAYNSTDKQGMQFQLKAEQDADDAELLVMGTVGDPFDELGADQVVKQLADMKGRTVNVRINSPGGLAYDGLTIFNALLQHEGGVTTTVEGLAGSAASLIAMAGNPVRMMANANMFIHRSQGIAFGNAITMRDMAEFLDSLDDGIAETYVSKTGLSRRRVNQLLDGKVDGTNMTAKDAKNLGFIDEVIELKRRKKATAQAEYATYDSLEPVTISPALIIPGNPPSGDCKAVYQKWDGLGLEDFTVDNWEDVGPNTRAAVARHFAVVPGDLATAAFGDFKLPHHDASGRPVVAAVEQALGELDSVPENMRERAEAHLRAHLPVGPSPSQLRNELDKRMVELRLQEIGA